MEMSHIAQQSRRDKLRIQQDLTPNPNSNTNSNSHQHLGVYANNLTQIPHDGTTYDSADIRSCRNGNICYDSSQFCSEMINFSKDSLMAIQDSHNPTSFNDSAAVSSDPPYYNTWKAIGSQPATDWVAANPNHSPIFAGEGSSMKIMNIGYHQDLHSPLNNADMNSSSSLYQNALQEIVTSSNARSFGLEFASLRHKSSPETGPWVGGGSELPLLPPYANQMCLNFEGDRDHRMVTNDNSNPQALSLTLSSVPSHNLQETQINEKDFPTADVCGSQDSRNLSSGSRILRTQPLTHRNPGPLGPFTGYATILRSSKFLRPAQLLLEELCFIARPKDVEIGDSSEKIFDDVRVSRDGVSNGGTAMKGMAGNSSGSSFVIDGSSFQPENLQKKAKLLYMQDEVCKRYKQYHQQMQMVVSSFETVAGLTAATPYVSLALKMISKHFRSLKNTITDQLKSLKNALGEESSPKGDANVSMLKLFDQSYQRDKGASVLEGQHMWRPQRGLPERAVSILRAWLFDHFLHPYPTDTDKHMLATQTGLTRNQVSNWFINARVRVWKPMVEEIHMLETKGVSVSSEKGSDSNAGKTTTEEGRMHAIPDKQVECSRVGSLGHETGRANSGMWNQEKRSRIDYHLPGNMEGPFMGGIGSVSLTLGLRQSAENGQRPIRAHYGGQVIRDFVG